MHDVEGLSPGGPNKEAKYYYSVSSVRIAFVSDRTRTAQRATVLEQPPQQLGSKPHGSEVQHATPGIKKRIAATEKAGRLRELANCKARTARTTAPPHRLPRCERRRNPEPPTEQTGQARSGYRASARLGPDRVTDERERHRPGARTARLSARLLLPPPRTHRRRDPSKAVSWRASRCCA